MPERIHRDDNKSVPMQCLEQNNKAHRILFCMEALRCGGCLYVDL